MRTLIVMLIFSIYQPLAFAQIGKCKGKYLGNIIANNIPGNYSSLWNQATSENGSKWGSIEGTKGSYNWTTSDLAYNWAKNNGGLFKFHTFVWGSQTPGWVSSASTSVIQASIENFIKAAAIHYSSMGGLKMIDVLNEPVNTSMPGNMKSALTAGYQAELTNAKDKNNPYGWVIWPFQLARKYFPEAVLLINEYNVEMNWNNCRSTYVAMIKAIKNAPNLTDGSKNLIDGVGLQCHGLDNLTAANFKACIDEIWNSTGVPVHITEFDQAANPNETKQKTVYSALIPVAWEHPHVAGITLWGYIQGSTWIKGNGQTGSGGTDSGIQYANGTDRPALTWLKQYFGGQLSLACCPAPAPFASCNGGTPPSIFISDPSNNTSFTAPATVTINANAADADGTISKVEFYSGSSKLGEDATLPYSFTWSNVTAGSYTITAKATDNSGLSTTSAAISINVTAGNVDVTGVSVNPENVSTFIGQTIQLTASIIPANATNKNISWTSSNVGVAAVSSNGLVTAVAKGTATITATTQQGLFSDACTVTVGDKPALLPLIKLAFNENSGTAVANTGSVAATFAKTAIPSWSTNVPVNGGASSVDFGTTTGNYYVESSSVISQLAGLTSFTITGWVNCRNSTVGSGGNRIVSWINNGANGVDVVYMSTGALKVGINQWPDASTAISSAGKITTNSSAVAANWKFFAVTYQSSTGNLQFYFGDNSNPASLDKSLTYSKGTVGTSIGSLAIGHFNSQSSRTTRTDRMFKGLIDQIEIYSSVLTPTQIQSVQSPNALKGSIVRNEPNGSSEVEVYPNPVSGLLNIKTGSLPAGKVLVTVFDATGKPAMATGSIDPGQALDISGLPAGIYIVKVSGAGTNAVKRIVKQ